MILFFKTNFDFFFFYCHNYCFLITCMLCFWNYIEALSCEWIIFGSKDIDYSNKAWQTTFITTKHAKNMTTKLVNFFYCIYFNNILLLSKLLYIPTLPNDEMHKLITSTFTIHIIVIFHFSWFLSWHQVPGSIYIFPTFYF
jgi:formate/nitrite transporter FocA (FNT family)